MRLTTEEVLRDVYLEAARHDLARSLKTGDDWVRLKEITQDATARIEAERAAHAHDYQARIAEAKQIILREEHGIRLDQPLPPGVEKQSDADRLQSIAETRVRQDYDRRIAVIKTDELDQYRDLTNAIRMRDRSEVSEQARSQSPERKRSGPTRE
ncbi:hypothetical protein [Shimia sp. MMG029]|uniref:hypothetical protein n=1 Tax=Shimia sp. MMG029 TaxID=3021978 RepID=UPI0022FEA6EA|nr:hypothetical protein [Shimia sp. MMG029]MDA5556058.1 hypothetical protein [Shimia sp. MMG029]